MLSLHSTTISRTFGIAGLITFISVVGCGGTAASRTVSNSDTTTQTSAGGQSRTTVRESTEQSADGAQNTERTTTVRTTTPAPVAPRP